MKRRNLGEQIVLISLASVWAIICLFPVWVLFSVTFSSDSTNMTQTYFPNSLSNGIENITVAVDTVKILNATWDTMLFSIVSIVGMLIICSLAAYEFAFFDFPLKKLLFGVLLASMMLPMILYVIPLYRFVFSIGLADTVWGVALPFLISPLSVFIMMQFLEDLPSEFIDSAKVDGAGHFRIFFSIVLPLLRNGLITATVLLFLRVWGSFLWPSLVTADKIQAMSVTIANLLSPQFYVDPRVKIASMLIAMLPPLIIYIFFQKYVIRGISMSGIKG